MRLATIALPLLALLSAFTAGCGKDAPETLIRLIIDSDLEVGTELTKLEVRIFDRDGKEELRRQDFALGTKREGARYALPLSIKLAPDSQGSSADFRLVVTGIGPVGEGGSDVEVVEQQATASFRPGQALRLDVFLARNCLFKLCRDAEGGLQSQTCDVETGTCAGVPEREDLPAADSDGTRLDEEEKSEAAVVAGATDGGQAHQLDSRIGEVSRQDADALVPDAASRSDVEVPAPDAANSSACGPSACQNGGMCSGTGAPCSCPQGFAGVRCEQDVCKPNPCEHGGICAGTAIGASCTCDRTGYSGSRCETEVNECLASASPCGPANTCVDGVADYTCRCAPTYLQVSAKRCAPKFSSVATSHHSCAIDAEQQAICWGDQTISMHHTRSRGYRTSTVSPLEPSTPARSLQAQPIRSSSVGDETQRDSLETVPLLTR
jgi:hypothetical protein